MAPEKLEPVIRRVSEVEATQAYTVDGKPCKGAKIKVLIGSKQGAERYYMRYFIIEPGGEIPKHSHWYEHEIFVVRGRGILGVGDKEYEVEAGCAIYIPPGVVHWYRNPFKETWEFICVIPTEKCR